MIRGWLHPRFRELNRFADQELAGPERERVTAHLARCARCRETVRFIHRLGGSAAGIHVADPPADALERILQRRADGDRVILPVVPPPSPPPAVKRVGPYAAAIVLLVVAAGLVGIAANLQADRSELRFEPSAPLSGSEVTAEYHGAMFDGEERLRLRAKYHYADGRTERVTATQLIRGDGGVRSGSFRLPDSVVYALFAVEDLEARRVDSNNRRLWGLLVHEEDGRPAFAALAEKMDDLVPWDWKLAHQTAREMVELYPESIDAWDRLLFMEKGGPTFGSRRDSVMAIHRARFRAFEEHFQEKAHITEEELALLHHYARAIEDSVAIDYWRKRLATQAPSHPDNAAYRSLELYRKLENEPGRLLASMEELWQRFGPVEENVALVGLEMAWRIGEWDAARKWARRRVPFRPEQRLPIAIDMADEPDELRAEGMRWLRQELDRRQTADQSERSLTRSLARHRSVRDEDVRSILVALGAALIEEGDTAAGLDTLRLGAEGGWDPGRFRTAARAYLAVGDTTAALPILARLVADPGTSAAFVDTARLRAGRRLSESNWDALVDAAREEMRQHVLSQAQLRYLPDEIPLLSADGGSHDLRILGRDKITVVAFWSRLSPHAIRQVPQLRRLADDLQRAGAELIAVTPELPSSEFTETVRNLDADFPIYHDVEAAAQRAFSYPPLPSYYVVDSNGRVRFDGGWDLQLIRRQVMALQMTEALPMLTN